MSEQILHKEAIPVEENLNIDYHTRRLIVLALKKNNGSRINSAHDLRVSNRTVIRKIREYKISESEYIEPKPHDGRRAVSFKYKSDYLRIISYINANKTFWLSDLRKFMGIKEYYSPITHLIDYLRTKCLVQRVDSKGSEIQYGIVRDISKDDLVFVKGNGVKVSEMTTKA